MTIDLYALCPCGSGKKIKFCCRDLAAEIDKVERLLEAGQRQAALEFIELAEKKYPGRAYLLARKAELQRALGLQAEADGTLRALLDREHDNPVALAESVLMALGNPQEGVRVAIERLQRTVDVCTRDPWPDKVKEAIAAVADHCSGAGYLPAALAHTVLFLETEPENEGAVGVLMQYCSSAQVPLLFKELGSFQSCPEGVTWREDFNSAMRQADRGAWWRAEQQLTTLSERVVDAPAIWHNLGVLRSWLAKEDAAADAWRRYAMLGVSLDDAVEAQATAVELSPLAICETKEVVRITYPIRSMDRVIATAKTDKRCVGHSLEFGGGDDQPPPRSTHLLLDGPLPSIESLTADAAPSGMAPSGMAPADLVPTVAGYLFVFGKETDREARLVFQMQRGERFAARQASIRELFGDALDPPQAEDVLGQRHLVPFWSFDELWFPQHTPLDQVKELRVQLRHRHVFDVWPRLPWNYLDGRTPLEAAGDPAGRIKLLGFLLYAELFSQRNLSTDFEFNVVRKHLGLPEAEPLPADSHPNDVPLARLARLPMEKLSDEYLQAALSRAVHYRASSAAHRAAMEVVARPSLDDTISKPSVYTTLALLAEDTRKALDFVDQARQLAEAEGESSARYDLHEVSLRLRRGEAEQAATLINHLLQEHIDEPGVGHAVRSLLVQMGVVSPDGRMRVRADELDASQGTAEPAAETPKLWTPGSDQAASSAKPALILPG